jgi:hypothetical protein
MNGIADKPNTALKTVAARVAHLTGLNRAFKAFRRRPGIEP